MPGGRSFDHETLTKPIHPREVVAVVQKAGDRHADCPFPVVGLPRPVSSPRVRVERGPARKTTVGAAYLSPIDYSPFHRFNIKDYAAYSEPQRPKPIHPAFVGCDRIESAIQTDWLARPTRSSNSIIFLRLPEPTSSSKSLR